MWKCREFVEFYYSGGVGTGYFHILLYVLFCLRSEIEFFYLVIKEMILLRVPQAEKRFETLERCIFGSKQIPFETLSLEGRLYHMDENCEAYHR